MFLIEIILTQCTMNSKFFRIFLTVLTLYDEFALGLTTLHEFVEAIRRLKVRSHDDPMQYTNNTDIIVVRQTDIESYEDNEGKDQSDENFDGDNVTDFKNNTILRSAAKYIKPPVTKRSLIQTTTAPVTAAELNGSKRRDHLRRIKELTEHMSEHFMSTLYFYNEVMRIKKTNELMDELRIMAVELEHPNYRWMRAAVLKCFKEHHVPPKPPSIWNNKPNNLVINILKDSKNHGVLI